MTRKEEVLALLDRLQAVPAADLEDQRLDFKEWDERSHKDAAAKILEAVVCMANGGGGAQGERWASIPAFTRNVTPAGTEVPVYDEDENGEPIVVGSRILATERVEIGMIRRQCTIEYKIVPIHRKVRELLAITCRRSPTSPVVEQWIGISLDEAVRMKPSFEAWQINRWPLIERGMMRLDCLRWLERHGYPQPAQERLHRLPVPFRRSLAAHT